AAARNDDRGAASRAPAGHDADAAGPAASRGSASAPGSTAVLAAVFAAVLAAVFFARVPPPGFPCIRRRVRPPLLPRARRRILRLTLGPLFRARPSPCDRGLLEEHSEIVVTQVELFLSGDDPRRRSPVDDEEPLLGVAVKLIVPAVGLERWNRERLLDFV